MVQTFQSFVASLLGGDQNPVTPAMQSAPIAPPPIAPLQAPQIPIPGPVQPQIGPTAPVQGPMDPSTFAMYQQLMGAPQQGVPPQLAPLQAPKNPGPPPPKADYSGKWVLVDWQSPTGQITILMPEANAQNLPADARVRDGGVIEGEPEKVAKAEEAGVLLTQQPPDVQLLFRSETDQNAINFENPVYPKTAPVNDPKAPLIGPVAPAGAIVPALNVVDLRETDPVKAALLEEAGIYEVPVDQMVVQDGNGNLSLIPASETAPEGFTIITYGGKMEKPEKDPGGDLLDIGSDIMTLLEKPKRALQEKISGTFQGEMNPVGQFIADVWNKADDAAANIPGMGFLQDKRDDAVDIYAGEVLPGAPAYMYWMIQNPEIVEEVRNSGYTDPESGEHFSGERAVWERFQADRGLIQRTLDDLTTDPLNVLPSMGTPATGLGKVITGLADEAPGVVAPILRGAGDVISGVGKIADIPERVLGTAVDATIKVGGAAGRGLGKIPVGDGRQVGDIFRKTNVTAARDAADEAENQLSDLMGQRSLSGGVVPEPAEDIGKHTFPSGNTATRLEDGSYELVTPDGKVITTDATWDGVQLFDQNYQPVIGPEAPSVVEGQQPLPPMGAVDEIVQPPVEALPTDRPVTDLGQGPEQSALPTDQPVGDLGQAPPLRRESEFQGTPLGKKTEADIKSWPDWIRPQTADERKIGKNRFGIDFDARPQDVARAMASELPEKWAGFMREFGNRLKRPGGFAEKEALRKADKSWVALKSERYGLLEDGFAMKRAYEVSLEADNLAREAAPIFNKHFGDEAELPPYAWKRHGPGDNQHIALDSLVDGQYVPGTDLSEAVELAIFHPDNTVADDALRDIKWRLSNKNDAGEMLVTKGGYVVPHPSLRPEMKELLSTAKGKRLSIVNTRNDYLAAVKANEDRAAQFPNRLNVDDANSLSRQINQVDDVIAPPATTQTPEEYDRVFRQQEDIQNQEFTPDISKGVVDDGREAVFNADLARSVEQDAQSLPGAEVFRRDLAAGAITDAPELAREIPLALPETIPLRDASAIPMGGIGATGKTPQGRIDAINKVKESRATTSSTPSETIAETLGSQRAKREARYFSSRERTNVRMTPDELDSFYVRGRAPSQAQMDTLGQQFNDGESIIERWDRYTTENLDAAGAKADIKVAEDVAAKRVINDWTLEHFDEKLMSQYNAELTRTMKGSKGADGKLVKPASELEAQITAVEKTMMRGGASKWGHKFDRFIAGLRQTFLYNVLTGPRYIQTQYLGNTVTMVLTKHFGTIPEYLDPKTLGAVVKAAVKNGEAPPSLLREVADGYGLTGRRQLTTGSSAVRDQIAGETIDDQMIMRSIPVLGKLSPFLANRTIKRMATFGDVLPREALYGSLMDKNLIEARRVLHERMAVNRPHTLPDQQFEDVWNTLDQRFTSSDIRELFGEYDQRWADRNARDWQEAVTKTDRAARDEVKRVFFDGGERNIDVFLKRVTFFHYWMSRATPLYTEAIARDPVYLYQFTKLMESIRDDDDLSGTKFAKWIQTPFGYNTLIRPDAFFATFASFWDDAGYTPEGENILGKMIRNSPIMVNPVISLVTNMLGMQGEAFLPDPAGLNKFIQFAQMGIDNANAEFGWNLPPARNFQEDGLAWLRTFTTKNLDFVPGINAVEYTDPMAYKENEIRSIIAELALGRGLSLDDPIVQQAMVDPESELYQSAMKRYARQDALDITLRILPITAVLYPKSQLASPKERTAAIEKEREGRVEGSTPTALEEQLYTERDLIAADSEYSRTMQVQQDEYQAIGTPEEQGAFRLFNAIKYGNTEEEIWISGTRYTPQDLMAMDEPSREALATTWATESGQTDAIAVVVDGRKAYRDEHPEYAEYTAWGSQARDYEGGVQQWWIDTIKGNPNAARWYNAQTPEDKANVQHLTSVEAFMAYKGESLAYYDSEPIPTRNMDAIPYGAGETTTSGTGSSTSTGSDSYTPTIQNISEEITTYQTEMVAYNQYVSQMFGGQQVDVDLLNPMAKQAVESNLRDMGIEKPRMGSNLYGYMQWAEKAGGGDQSVAAYLKWWATQNPETTPTTLPVEPQLPLTG